ncbi:hypothetical protein [Streptomyces sp. NBC_00091]|uniref:hypothetical protein n=1 Tax=Streptomyces sp. NBC_00091 TaxID=2975648 RepID=UPI0022532E1C|nr:hypothetical protein [Streptomyces sp. NBC_00091]MCX5376887.1 hypothetical protein [Streptomyces sp. NBC_00091]
MNATPRPRDVHELIRVLPDVPVLRDRCRALAALEALMGAQCGPYFDYDPTWGPGVEAALMNNGSGDEYTILFTSDGVFGRGFDHESWMSPYTNDDMALWPGLVDTLPEVFRPLLAEPAFCDDEVQVATVVFWRETTDTAWRAGPVEPPEHGADGTAHLFDVLAAGTPEAYAAWAEDYYERPLDLDAIRWVWDLRPLTATVATTLNPAADPAAAAKAVAGMGWPTGE